MGPDSDFEDLALVGARKGSERLAAVWAALVVVGEIAVLEDGREVGVVASGRAGATRLLAACAGRLGSRARVVGLVGAGRGGFGLASVEQLLEEADFGLEFGDAKFK
jgi:hypothetical protein